MTAIKEMEIPIKREKFEEELHRVATESTGGWNGTFAMVTLGVMFMARSISDVAIAIDKHGVNVYEAHRQFRNNR